MHPERDRRLWILALSGFVTSFGAHVVATNLPAYAKLAGAGAFTLGLLIGVYDFAELFAKPLAGFVAGRAGLKRTLLVGLALFILGSLLFWAVPPGWLLLVRFVQGLGAAALSTVSITLVATYFENGRGRAFGLYNALKGAGYVLAPGVGGWLVGARGFSAIFAVSALVGALALLASLALPSDQSKADLDDDDDDDLSLKEFFSIFREPRLLPAYLVIFVNMFLVGILFGFVPVYLYGLGYPPARSGLLISLIAVTYLLVQPFAGSLGDRFGMRSTVLAGLLTASAAVAAVTFLHGPGLVACLLLAGAGVGTVWTNTDALVSHLASRRQLGASVAAAQSFKELGDMLGPLTVGALTQGFNLQLAFVACSATAAVAVAVFALAYRGVSETPHSGEAAEADARG